MKIFCSLLTFLIISVPTLFGGFVNEVLLRAWLASYRELPQYSLFKYQWELKEALRSDFIDEELQDQAAHALFGCSCNKGLDMDDLLVIL